MLGKMLIHGLVAAALVGSAAAVYAQAKDNGYLSPEATQTKSGDPADLKTGDGYVRPTVAQARERDDERDHAFRSERHRDRHGRRRGHDDDDD